jgi:hypothetical protein
LPEHVVEEAAAAKQAATEHLNQVRARDREVRQIAQQLREIRERNGFSEGLRAMLAQEGQGHAPHA